MDMQFYGANCLTFSSKQARVVVDDTMKELGAKPVGKEGDVYLFTGNHADTPAAAKIVIDMPGEYEASGVSIFGIQVRAHIDEAAQKTGVMYKITWGDVDVLVTGHVFPKLTESQLEEIGRIDVMFVPIGGNGYTTDATGALQLVKQVEPKIVIPTNYADSALSYEVPQASLEDALKNLGMEPQDTTKKYQFKPSEVTDTTQLIVLEKA